MDEDLAHLRGLTRLRTLDLHKCKLIRDAALAHLKGLTALEELDLSQCRNISDAGLAHLGSLTQLKDLDLGKCKRISDAGLAHLKGLTALERLDLRFCEGITDAGLAHLGALTRLKDLNLAFCNGITDAGLAHLKGLTALERLDLRSCDGITGAGLAHLKALTALERLNLWSCDRITDRGLAHLGAFTRLRDLDLEFCRGITGAGLAHLKGLTALERLSLGYCERITDSGLAHLKPLTALERLHLWGCEQITDRGLAHLGALRRLKELDLRSCKEITGTGLSHLKTLAALERLDLGSCESITDAGLAHLGALTRLKELDLGGCKQITDTGLSHLKTLTVLRELDLSKCHKITDSGLAHLKDLTALERLWVSGCKHVTAAGLAQLKEGPLKQALEKPLTAADVKLVLELWPEITSKGAGWATEPASLGSLAKTFESDPHIRAAAAKNGMTTQVLAEKAITAIVAAAALAMPKSARGNVPLGTKIAEREWGAGSLVTHRSVLAIQRAYAMGDPSESLSVPGAATLMNAWSLQEKVARLGKSIPKETYDAVRPFAKRIYDLQDDAKARTAPSPARPSQLADSCQAKARSLLPRLNSTFGSVVRAPFVVVGNLPGDKLSRVADQIVLRSATAMWKSYFDRKPTEPIVVLLLRDTGSYKHWARKLLRDTVTTPYGYYNPSARTVVVNAAAGLGTAIHGITHALTQCDFPSAPGWLRQGLAGLHEHCRFKDGRIIGLPNWRLDVLRKAAREKKLRPLADVVASKSRSADLSSAQLAQARYLFMYLQHQGVLEKFYRAIRRRGAAHAVAAIEELLGKRIAEVEADFFKWVRTLRSP